MCFYSFKLFAEKHPALSVTRLRHIYFNREDNGSTFAFKKVGRSVFVAESKILKWIDLQNEKPTRGNLSDRDLEKLRFDEIEEKILVDKEHLIEWAAGLINSKITSYLVTK